MQGAVDAAGQAPPSRDVAAAERELEVMKQKVEAAEADVKEAKAEMKEAKKKVNAPAQNAPAELPGRHQSRPRWLQCR